jgi:hypothetical protein
MARPITLSKSGSERMFFEIDGCFIILGGGAKDSVMTL